MRNKTRFFLLKWFERFARRNLIDFIPDKFYLKLQYRLIFDKKLDFKKTETFNEKLQWLKLYNKNPAHTVMADKYLVKEYVSEKIGDQYVAKLLGVWDRIDEIDLTQLPDKFVLKTTHDCGGVVVCKDKAVLNLEKAKLFLHKHMKRKYFYHCREWPYKNIKPRIIAEEFLEDADNEVLPVYKILCFNGVPKIIQTIQNDKTPNETIDYFDTNWNILDLRQNYPNSAKPLSRPPRLDEMLAISEQLAKGTSFIRVDLYSANGNIYFSEFTFFSDAGFAPFYPNDWDKTLGDWITLPNCDQSQF